MGLRKILAEEGILKLGSKTGLDKEIDFLKSNLIPSVLDNFRPAATPKDVELLRSLIKALEKRDRREGKRLADLLGAKWPTLIGNRAWDFILDGREDFYAPKKAATVDGFYLAESLPGGSWRTIVGPFKSSRDAAQDLRDYDRESRENMSILHATQEGAWVVGSSTGDRLGDMIPHNKIQGFWKA